MGILNVTPDSFSDGGRFATIDAAVVAAEHMQASGASIIDIGGESTRPGAQRVSPDEQIARVCPVIEKLRLRSDVLISVDTTLSEVAAEAIAAGAQIVNDVAAGREDPRLFSLVAKHGCGLILMHRRALPQEDSFSDQYEHPPHYEDVVAEVLDFLHIRCEMAEQAGVQRSQLVIDPGLGFGKTVSQNYSLLSSMSEFVQTGYPVLCAASRKSFLGAAAKISDPRARDVISVATAVAAHTAGVRLFRVHDVLAHQQALAVASRIAQPRSKP